MAGPENDLHPAERLKKLVEAITTSGEPQVDPDLCKKVKKICKSDSQSIPFVFDLLMESLARNHSQVRLAAFQLLDELFQRSHAFRELVVAKLKTVIELTLDTDAMSLPPPKSARDVLKKLALETVQSWVKKFGEGYKKLSLGYNYLKQVKKVDFNDLEARNSHQRARDDERKRKMDNIWKERVKKVRQEMEETRSEIEICQTQIGNCFRLLLPDPATNDFEPEKREETEDLEFRHIFDEDGPVASPSSREHGIASTSSGISVKVKEDDKIDVENGNETVVENLRDQFVLLTNRFLPLIKKWTVTLTKAGENCSSDLLKSAIDLKQNLEESETKVNRLNLDLSAKSKSAGDTSDTSDDDFVEVEDKGDDYEEDVVAGPGGSLLGIPFYASSNTSEPHMAREPKDTKTRPKRSAKIPSVGQSSMSKSQEWNVGAEDSEMDPTTAKATLTKIRERLKVDLDSASQEPRASTSTSSNSLVPTRSYDDLANWGEEFAPRKVLVDEEKLRFWGGNCGGREDQEMIVPGTSEAEQRQRIIEFSGEFQPVQWTCRAPLPSGRLCPRQDRLKCPLHGKILPRDEAGTLADFEDRLAEEQRKEDEKNRNPEWQDPKLLAEIKVATGKDLKIPAKRGEKRKDRGDRKKRKYPGLVDIKEASNTTRSRLEKRIFNRGSMKRVAASLDKSDAKRYIDKYGDQFNYM